MKHQFNKKVLALLLGIILIVVVSFAPLLSTPKQAHAQLEDVGTSIAGGAAVCAGLTLLMNLIVTGNPPIAHLHMSQRHQDLEC